MTATLPFTPNRIASHFQPPARELPELPKSARERGRIWSDAVFQAVLALQYQLRSPDAAVVAAAANSILELERTRMRHAQDLAGSEEVSEAQEVFEAEQRQQAEMRRPMRRSQPEPVPPPPSEPKRPASPALAKHACAARESMAKTGYTMTEAESVQFTEGMLERMGLEPDDVSPVQFAAMVGQLRESIEGERTAA